MDVTRQNFDEVAREIEALLPSVDFVAIDEEMTGIGLPGVQEAVGDTPAERYSKMRTVASWFNIIQFGVALFSKDAEKKYVARAYNFYVFPEKGFINMEATSIHFNSKNGVDWNKWIREGVPYVDKEGAEKLRAALPNAKAEPSSQTQPNQPQGVVLSNARDKEITSKALEELNKWLADESRTEEKEFEMVTTNGFLRKFIYQSLEESFPGLTVESRVTKSPGLKTMVALRLDDAEKRARELQQRSEQETDLARKLGLRRVFLALASSKKPLVGHALIFDLLFALSHFEGPLPDSYDEFKASVRDLFPTLFDTQLLAKSRLLKPKNGQRFHSYALGQVHAVLKQENEAKTEAETVEIVLAEGHQGYGSSARFHEAGYDAFVTGCVFAYMAETAGLKDAEAREEFNGRLVLFRNFFHMNIHGDDELVTPGAYLHISGIKSQASDLQELLQSKIKELPHSASDSAEFEVKRIDGDNAFAIFPEKARAVVEALCEENCETAGLKFMLGERWLDMKENPEPPRKRPRLH
ncbi:unnamed protein product [Effrenium voratum]|uniref:Uncharacterized protein n=1 Tax=Effrenium voratum TaxID=2562239 RepID=A0AA36MV60_9DINO|nr:unnamed protein product [Effrenium voratum]